eukprot:scaffold193878_cov25-Tisochrysis_lutea.AAC.2
MYGWNRRQWPYDGRMGAHLDVELLYSLVAEHVSSRLDGDDVSVLSERLMSSDAVSGLPVTGCRRNFFRYGTMLSKSKTMPSAVHIGDPSNGRREIAQQSNGST